jgi:hypothetical protein
MPIVMEIPGERVLIVGRVHEGTSSLINRLLNEQLCRVHAGDAESEPARDVTSSDPRISVIFHERPGFEHERYQEEKAKLERDVRSWSRSFLARNHCAAVLIVTSGMFADAERAVARMADQWHIPLGIVFTKHRVEDPGDYGIEPNNEDESDNLEEVNVARRELRLSGIDPSTVRMFFVNSVREISTDRVGGFERLARGLKDMVTEGLGRTRARILAIPFPLIDWNERADEIIHEAASQCGLIAGIVIVPMVATIANLTIPRRMVVRLLEFFEVQGDLPAAAEVLVNRYGDAKATVGLVAADIIKVIPFLGWVVGGVGGSVGCRRQTTQLGFEVKALLVRLSQAHGSLTSEDIIAAVGHPI